MARFTKSKSVNLASQSATRRALDPTEQSSSLPESKQLPLPPNGYLPSSIEALQNQPSPSASEAVSAFIKSVRLRKTEDAVAWLFYLWHQPNTKPRIQRRILLASGEDNLSVGVTESVSDWYNSARRRVLPAAAGEVARICRTPNWWGQPDGYTYISEWRKAELVGFKNLPRQADALMRVIESAVVERNALLARVTFNALYANRGFRPKEFAPLMTRLAMQSGSDQAQRLAQVYSRNVSAFWLDGNVSGQALDAVLNGNFGDQTVPAINALETVQLIARAQQRVEAGLYPESWALDSIHTSRGSDRRFAGVLISMLGCCRAFAHYGRLSPDDPWLPSFTEPPA